MILRHRVICHHPRVFKKLTGLSVHAFDVLLEAVLPHYQRAEHQRLHRSNRLRATGGGDHSELSATDQILLTIIWLYRYPRQDLLGDFFGVSQPTVWRIIQRVEPILVQTQQDYMRQTYPGRKHHRTLSDLLSNVPELVAVIGKLITLQAPTNEQVS